MNRPAPAAESQTHCSTNKFGNPSRIVDEERAFRHRGSHMHLVDLLLAAAPQVMEIGATRDGDDRAFAVRGVGEPGNRIGKARSGVHTNARLLGDTSPGICHMDSRLFVAGIDYAEVLIRHSV